MLSPDVVKSAMYAAIPYLLVSTAAAAGGILLILFLLWRYRGARVERLTVAAKYWAHGDWGQRAGISGRDSLGNLGRALDHAADYVQARLANTESQAQTLAEQAALLDLAHDAILVWDIRTGAIRFWNTGAEELYGWTRAEAMGRTPQAVLRTVFPMPLEAINAELIRSRYWEGELVHTRHDGTQVVVASRWALQENSDGHPAAVMGINSDVTERRRAESALKHQALHDGLTGLPNRTLFNNRLVNALAHADREGQSVAVLFLDMDNFKVINDTSGHEAGDALLIEVARRLQSCLRAGDTVARLGGDEFTLLTEQGVEEPAAERLAERIAGALSAPVRVLDRQAVVSASIGIAVSTPRQSRPDVLMREADTAMYQAKAAGKARYAVFDSRLNRLAIERLEMESDLRNAVLRDQLRLHYQPIYSLWDGHIAELEALVRWERPGHGLVPPASFIPAAEDSGLIVPIGQWVLEEACRQVCIWHALYPNDPPVVVSVNLSGRQLDHPELVNDIEHALQAAGLNPRFLKLEVTESVAMQDAETTLAKLRALKALGIQLAIDDFGTGYSSLAYLRRFPVDTLKVDRAFVVKLGHDPMDTAIVQSILELAKTLRLSVTAEGIETREQEAHLQALGCDRGQGYLFGRPMPADRIPALLSCLASPVETLSCCLTCK